MCANGTGTIMLPPDPDGQCGRSFHINVSVLPGCINDEGLEMHKIPSALGLTRDVSTASTHKVKRTHSNPACSHIWDGNDESAAIHLRHDRSMVSLIHDLNDDPDIKDLISRFEVDALMGGPRAATLLSKLRPFVRMEEVQRTNSKRAKSPEECESSTTPCKNRTSGGSSQAKLDVPIAKALQPTDWITFFVVGLVGVSIVIALCVWANNGLLPESKIGHVYATKTRVGHVHAPLFMTPTVVELHGTGNHVFDVRLVGMALANFSTGHRRLQSRSLTGSTQMVTGNLTYRLLADGVEFFQKVVDLSPIEEVEHFETVDVGAVGMENAARYTAEVVASRSDGEQVSFLMQVVRMTAVARHRVLLGLAIFIVTFASIIAERIHRCYSAFIGSSVTLCMLAAIQETPSLHTITGMIDWGTIMLLFSMMILMQMLAMTGFFRWFALKVVMVSNQSPRNLFFLLTNICGVMSMLLDNVTVVLLCGPLTYQIARRMKLNPRPLYLSMTICATIGGTATRVGDPPNIVIGSKMEQGFEKFIMVNFPIVIVVLLPLSSILLYQRTSGILCEDSWQAPKLDLEMLVPDTGISNQRMFGQLSMVLFAVLVALILSPVHLLEPSWFTMMALLACALMFDRHHIGKFLEFAEWDTLLFFAFLFVFVEGLSELGLIPALGDSIVRAIEFFSEDIRMYVALIIILWASALGSAFLESLPYTTTIIYILLDLERRPIRGVDVSVLCWPLSIGACVGGIGSIMGSSANLVCIAVSNRCSSREEDRVHGRDFLKYGLPTLFVLTAVSTVWLIFLFIWVGYRP